MILVVTAKCQSKKLVMRYDVDNVKLQCKIDPGGDKVAF